MLEPLSSAEVHRQHAELLPARTVLSLFSTPGPSSDSTGGRGGSTTANSPITLFTLFDHQTNSSSFSGDSD